MILIDSLRLNMISELEDRKQLLSRLGFWNCLYGAIGHYRISAQADIRSRSNSARVTSNTFVTMPLCQHASTGLFGVSLGRTGHDATSPCRTDPAGADL